VTPKIKYGVTWTVHMPGFPDDERFDFNKDGMDWRPDQVQAARDGAFGDLYRHDLDVAIVLDRWAKNMRHRDSLTGQYAEGFAHALEEVAARLRQADYVPGNGEVPA
jgi:hypothetical protein